jgi:hypothetical protein
MCCLLLLLALLGPRIFGPVWWLLQPPRWEAAFRNFADDLWWIWAVLGIIFLPWTTLMYVLVAPGGVVGWEWVLLGVTVVADIVSYGGGIGRKQVPGYEGY